MPTNATISPLDTAADPVAPALRWFRTAPWFQAGLAGYSDSAMRMVARKHGCPYCITEAMLDSILVAGGKGQRHAELVEGDHPIAGQIIGSDPADMATSARLLIGMGYDVIDVNFGCPVKKIRKKNRGGWLLSAPEEAVAILDAVVQAVGGERPVTVKMRRSYNDTPEMVANFYRIFEKVIELGYAGVTVHGRTVEQKYIGPSRWPFLTDLTTRYRREMDRGFVVFGSGDAFTPQAIHQMLATTGVHGVSVARGCIGNPWVFTQAAQILRGEMPTPPTIAQQRRVLLEHFELSVQENGEKLAGRMMRKFGIKFSLHHPRSDDVKAAFIRVTTLAEWGAVLDAFYPEGDDSPGVMTGSGGGEGAEGSGGQAVTTSDAGDEGWSCDSAE